MAFFVVLPEKVEVFGSVAEFQPKLPPLRRGLVWMCSVWFSGFGRDWFMAEYPEMGMWADRLNDWDIALFDGGQIAERYLRWEAWELAMGG